MGTDGISYKLLRMGASSIASGITHVINLSISASHCPTALKMVPVCPRFTSGKPDDKSNYRPISVLCVMSKILEKHEHKNLYELLMHYSLVHLAQSGFRRLHPSETALANMVSQSPTSMNKGDLTGLVLLDL